MPRFFLGPLSSLGIALQGPNLPRQPSRFTPPDDRSPPSLPCLMHHPLCPSQCLVFDVCYLHTACLNGEGLAQPLLCREMCRVGGGKALNTASSQKTKRSCVFLLPIRVGEGWAQGSRRRPAAVRPLTDVPGALHTTLHPSPPGGRGSALPGLWFTRRGAPGSCLRSIF